jgi:signal peptidase II
MIDQGIKLIIYKYFLDTRFDILSPVLEFYPKFNDNYSYVIKDLLHMELSGVLYVLFILVIQILAIHMYVKKRKYTESFLLDFVFILFEAGYLSALFSYIFWEKGCLDFIYLKGLFIFDLKDIYLTVFGFSLYFYLVRTNILDKKNNK